MKKLEVHPETILSVPVNWLEGPKSLMRPNDLEMKKTIE
jgi:hypothetical protein